MGLMAENKSLPRPQLDFRQEWRIYRRLLQFVRPYWPRLAMGICFAMIYGCSVPGMLFSLQHTLAAIFDPNRLPWPVVIAAAALLPVFALLWGLGGYFSIYFMNWVGNRVVMDLRKRMFAHIHELPLLFFSQSRTGELISRTTNDTMQVERGVSNVIGEMVREPFVLIGAIAYLFWLNAMMAGASLLLFPICIIPVAIFGRRVRRFARESQQKLADMVSIMQETIMGARIVKAFGMEGRESQRFDQQAQAVFSRVMKVVRANAAIDPLVVFISFVGLALALVYVRWIGMTFDQFVTFAAALVLMYQPVKKLSRVHLAIQQSSGAADRIFELLDMPITVSDQPGAVVFEGPVREIEYRGVTFAYGAEPVLSDLNFIVSAGQCVALVGSSGSGKTTLVSLLPRFYDVRAGAILFNGCDVRGLTLASLRRQIGIVTQETILFNDTVANNIAYGLEGSSRQAIEDAARRAHAHEFIMAMPEGYETIIGERGLRLSGGECQRLAIARAILRNPPVLILDEATSALDTESERQVQAALDELMEHRTVFVIAHRLSTIVHADLILVLDKGRIVERGAHTELLAQGGVYQYLYNLQIKEA